MSTDQNRPAPAHDSDPEVEAAEDQPRLKLPDPRATDHPTGEQQAAQNEATEQPG